MKQSQHLLMIGLLALLTACASAPREEKPKVNIYDALENDNIQYRAEEENQPASQTSPEFLNEKIGEVRSLFFRYRYDEATDLAERLIRLDGSLAEAYYWLARIHMNQASYQQAYAMASKGLTVVQDPRMKTELERIQRQAQMGAN